MVFVAAGILLAFLYFLLQAHYLFHWYRTRYLKVRDGFQPKMAVSVIVVARNEEAHIEKTIKSILQQSFPQELFELIIVDDRSVDETAEIARRYQSEHVRVVRLADYPTFIHSPAFKKSGIEVGVHLAKFDFIVVTDADCLHHDSWLKTISYAIESFDVKFMTGPVVITHNGTSIGKMQQMEATGLLLATAGGIHSGLHTIANGANMTFSKNAFLDVKGYEGNYHYASGDDMFLAEKMKQHYPDHILFVKSPDAVVYTSAKDNWDALIKQRIRWAGKNKGLKDPVINSIWLLIGLYHFMIILFLLLSIMDRNALIAFFILLLPKLLIDYMSVGMIFKFFNRKINVLDFLIFQVMYTYYVITMAFQMLAGKKGDWK